MRADHRVPVRAGVRGGRVHALRRQRDGRRRVPAHDGGLQLSAVCAADVRGAGIGVGEYGARGGERGVGGGGAVGVVEAGRVVEGEEYVLCWVRSLRCIWIIYGRGAEGAFENKAEFWWKQHCDVYAAPALLIVLTRGSVSCVRRTGSRSSMPLIQLYGPS